DANCAYDAGTALALGARMEELNLMWWEEPLLADDLAGYDRLSSGLRMPIASGETMSTDRLILDYVQPRRALSKKWISLPASLLRKETATGAGDDYRV
ncbi:MAG: enolase C-terminal domain-like protein, partial [Acidobacteriota bacterium]